MPTSAISEAVESRIVSALMKLRTADSWLLEVPVHEQSITAKLGSYLQLEFSQYDVDCEYNKHFENEKIRASDGVKARPDIIIHRRNKDHKNLLVIEVKKRDLRQGVDSEDKRKLRDLTKRRRPGYQYFGYKYGLFIEFVGKDLVNLSWFVNGEEMDFYNSLSVRKDKDGLFHYMTTIVT